MKDKTRSVLTTYPRVSISEKWGFMYVQLRDGDAPHAIPLALVLAAMADEARRAKRRVKTRSAT